MSAHEILVLKLGSSVLGRLGDLPAAAREVAAFVREGWRVLAVVSAVGKGTEALLDEARGLAATPEDAALAALLATGERRSAALLSIALHESGLSAALLDPVECGLLARGPVLDAEPSDLGREAVLQALRLNPVAVLPGFFGRVEGGGVALFGRGGSDLTAVFAASALGARCRLQKDVGGVFDRDPASEGARLYREITWDDALALSARVVQAKALELARGRRLSFEVGETLVGPGPTRLAAIFRPGSPEVGAFGAEARRCA